MVTESQKNPETKQLDSEQEVNDLLVATMDTVLADIRKADPGISIPPDVERVLDDFVEFLPDDHYDATLKILEAAKAAQKGAPTPNLDHLISDIKHIRTQHMAKSNRAASGLGSLGAMTGNMDLAKNANEQKARLSKELDGYRDQIDALVAAGVLGVAGQAELNPELADLRSRVEGGEAVGKDVIDAFGKRLVDKAMPQKELNALKKLVVAIQADPAADATLKQAVNQDLYEMIKLARDEARKQVTNGTIAGLVSVKNDLVKWLNDPSTEAYRKKIEADEAAARAAKAAKNSAPAAATATPVNERSVRGIIERYLGQIPLMIQDPSYAAQKAELEALLVELQGAPAVKADPAAASAIANKVKTRIGELKGGAKGGEKLDPKLEEAKTRVLDAARKRLASPKNGTEQEALQRFVEDLEHADAKGVKQLVRMYEQKGGLRISHSDDPLIKGIINERIDDFQMSGADDDKIESELVKWRQELQGKYDAWQNKTATDDELREFDAVYRFPDRLRRAIELLDEKLGWIADDKAKGAKPAKKGGKAVPGGPKPDVEGLVKSLDDAAKAELTTKVQDALPYWNTNPNHPKVLAFLADHPGFTAIDAGALFVRLMRDVKPATPPARPAAATTPAPAPAPATAGVAAPSAPAAPDARKATAEAERKERVTKIVEDTLMKGKTLDELKDMVKNRKMGFGLTTAEEKALQEYVDALDKEPGKDSVVETVVAAYAPPFDVEGLKLLRQAVEDKKAKKPVSGMLKSLSLAELLDAIRRIEAIPKRSTASQKPTLDPQDMGAGFNKKPEAKPDTRTPAQKLAGELGVPVNSKGLVDESALDRAVVSFYDRGGKLTDLSPEGKKHLRERLGETIADLESNPARTPDEEKMLFEARTTRAAILKEEKGPTRLERAETSVRNAGAKFMDALKDAVRYHIHGETGESYKKKADGSFERDANGDLIVEERHGVSKGLIGITSFFGNAVMIGTGTKLLPETVLTFTQSVFRSQTYKKSLGEMGSVMNEVIEQAKKRRLENKAEREKQEEAQNLMNELGVPGADKIEMQQAVADLDPAVMEKIRGILESNAYISLEDKKRVRERMAQVLERHLKADIEDREGIQSEMKLLLDAGMEKRKNMMGVAKEAVNSTLLFSSLLIPVPLPLRRMMRLGAYAGMGAMEDRGRQQREQILSGEYKKDAVELEKIGAREILVEAANDYVRRLIGKNGTAEAGKAWAKLFLASGGATEAAYLGAKGITQGAFDAAQAVLPTSWQASASEFSGDVTQAVRGTVSRAFAATGVPALFPGWGGGSGGDDNEMINEVNRRFMNQDLDRSLPGGVDGGVDVGASADPEVRELYDDLNAVRDGRSEESGVDTGSASVDAPEVSASSNDVSPDGRPYAPINFEALDPKDLTLVDQDNEHYGITQVLALQFERDPEAWGWDGKGDKRAWAVRRALELAMAADDWNPGDDQTHMTTAARDVIAIIPRHEAMFDAAEGGNRQAIGYTFYNIQTKEVLTREQLFEKGFANNPGYAENILPKDIQNGQPASAATGSSTAPEAAGGSPAPDLGPTPVPDTSPSAAAPASPDIQILSRFSTEPIGPVISGSEATPLPADTEVARGQFDQPQTSAAEAPAAETPAVETGSASGRSTFEFSSLEGDKLVGQGYHLKTQGYEPFPIFERPGSDAYYIDASSVIDNLSTQPREQALLTQFASKHGLGENPARDEAYKELFVYVRLLLAMHKTGIPEPATFDRLLKGFVEARSEALQAGAIPEFGQYSQPDNDLAKLKIYMDRRLTEMESETSPRT